MNLDAYCKGVSSLNLVALHTRIEPFAFPRYNTRYVLFSNRKPS